MLFAGLSGLLGCQTPTLQCERNAACDQRPGGYCELIASGCVYPDSACGEVGRFSEFAGQVADDCAHLPGLLEQTAVVHRLAAAFSIDGDPTELQAGPPLLRSVSGLQARIWLRWNRGGLLVAAEVDDPSLEAAGVTEAALSADDGITLRFDTGWNSDGESQLDRDDFEFIVTAANATGAASGSFEPASAWGTDLESAVTRRGTLNQPTDSDAGYSLELFVPWSPLFPAPDEGARWAVQVVLNDRSNARTAPGRDSASENDARTVVFIDGKEPEDLGATRVATDGLPAFRNIPLGPRLQSDSDNLAPEMPTSALFDGCTSALERCTTGTKPGESELQFEFDLGAPHELGALRLFGNHRFGWDSRLTTLRYRLEEADPWKDAFRDESTAEERWQFEPLEGLRARFISVEVDGGTGGAAVRELELYARPSPGS